MKILAIPFSLFLLISCDDGTKKVADYSQSPAMTKTPDSLSADRPPVYKWNYSEDEDKMTSKKILYATIDANELLDLKFPYSGGVTATIMIRKKNGENNAVLELSKGQFMTGVDGEDIGVRFDNLKAETYSCAESNDGDNRYLFISSANRFINKLKRAKQLIVQAVLYDNGTQQMEFDVTGFKWDH